MMGRYAFPMLLLLVAACADDGANMTETAKDRVDPALAVALEDQILIDPTLSQQANEDAIRPPDRPVMVLMPLVQHALEWAPVLDETVRKRVAAIRGCSRPLSQSFAFAARLPAELMLPAKAVVRGAAGSDAPGCVVRFVSFWSPDGIDAAASRYLAVAARAGYKAKRNGPAIEATRPDGALFAVSVEASEGGSAIRLLTRSAN